MSIGFPDYQRGPAASSPVLLNSAGPIDTFHDYAAFATSAWGFTNFLFDTTASTDFYYVNFRWNNSLSLGDFNWEDTMTFGPGQFHAITLANRSPFLQIHVVNLTLGVGHTVKVYSYGSLVQDPITTTIRQGQPLFSFNQSVAASGHILTSGFPTAPGRCTVNAGNAGTGPWRVSLQYYDLGSKAFTVFWFFAGGGTNIEKSGSWQVMLPPAPIQFQLINDDTAAHTFEGGISMG